MNYIAGFVAAVPAASKEAYRRHVTEAASVLKEFGTIVTFDAARRIELFNDAAEKIFACSAAEALGQPVDRFLTDTFRNTLERATATKPFSGQTRARPHADPLDSSLRSELSRVSNSLDSTTRGIGPIESP